MRKISFIFNIVVITQGILLVLIADFFLSRQYMNAWTNYPGASRSATVYLKDVAQNRQADVQQYLLQTSAEQHLFLVRRDALLNKNGYYGGYKIGVYGDPTINGVSVSFLGDNLLNTKNLSMLLTSKSQNSTLGIDTGSINSIGAIPYFYFGGRIVVEKMPQLISDSTTVNGVYSILGFGNESQKGQFISELSKTSGLPEKALVTQTNGAENDNSFQRNVLIIFLALQVFLNIILFLVIAVRHLSEQGNLALLGWSRISFAAKIFGSFLITSIIGIPFFVVIGWLLSGWNEFSPMLFSYLFMAAVINLALVVMELAVASVVIMMTKSLDAIRGRFSKKPLYILGILAYLLVSTGLVASASYVDGPMQSISENAKVLSNWTKVSGYQMLNSISVGQDADSFSGQSSKLDQDMFDWYSSIADKKGVFLIHTTYYNRDILAGWSAYNSFKTIPEKPFWYFAVSPNYLSNLHIQLSHDELSDTNDGTRLYLLPSTLSNTARERITAWIRESDSVTGDIQNKFTQHKNFKFVTYKSEAGLFTWAAKSGSATTESAPIISVCTPQNMCLMENGSLRANGFNGYIKFANENTMKRYTQPDRMRRFNLDDNNVVFSSVKQYIDGLQKSLWTAIEWFGFAFVFLFIILVGLLITLATIFRIANQEKINVKKFLGFNFWQLYKAPTLMLISLVILELIAPIALRSKFGILLLVISSSLQLLIFARYLARSELKSILLAFKGGSQ